MLSFADPILTKNWRKTNLVASGNANVEQPKIFSSFSDTVRSGQSGASKSFNVPLAHPERGRERRDANVFATRPIFAFLRVHNFGPPLLTDLIF
jgi:hypothetical protein